MQPFTRRVSVLLFIAMMISAFDVEAQILQTPGSESKTSTPKPKRVYKSTPSKQVSVAKVSFKLRVNRSVIVTITNTKSASLSESIAIDNKTKNQETEFRAYKGTSLVKVKLPGKRSDEYDEFITIDEDTRLIIITVNTNGEITQLNVKTRQDFEREELKRKKDKVQFTLDVINKMLPSTISQTSPNLYLGGMSDALNSLVSFGAINYAESKSILTLLKRTKTLQTSLINTSTGYTFFLKESNYSKVYQARKDLTQAINSFNYVKKIWNNKPFGQPTFMRKVEVFISSSESYLGKFPSSQSLFNQKVKRTVENKKKLEEEERQRKERERKRIERERREREARRLAKEREERLYRERMIARYNNWESKSGIFLGLTFPLGLEFGPVASDRTGHLTSIRSSSSFDLLLVNHNFMWHVGGGAQFGLGLMSGYAKDELGLGLGTKISYVRNGFMFGLDFSLDMINALSIAGVSISLKLDNL